MYDIFISCKSEDYPDAKQIYEFLSSENYSVFLADRELRKLGSSEFGEAIDAALESAQHLIVFTSNPKYLETGYVKSEWRTFIEEKRSGRKSGNLLTILKNVHTNDLPIALRHFQSFDYKDYATSLLDYVGGKKTIGLPKGRPGILKLRCNVDSLVYVDDEFKDKLEGGKMKKIGLMPGEYLIKVVAADDESVFEEVTVNMEDKDQLKDFELSLSTSVVKTILGENEKSSTVLGKIKNRILHPKEDASRFSKTLELKDKVFRKIKDSGISAKEIIRDYLIDQISVCQGLEYVKTIHNSFEHKITIDDLQKLEDELLKTGNPYCYFCSDCILLYRFSFIGEYTVKGIETEAFKLCERCQNYNSLILFVAGLALESRSGNGKSLFSVNDSLLCNIKAESKKCMVVASDGTRCDFGKASKIEQMLFAMETYGLEYYVEENQ